MEKDSNFKIGLALGGGGARGLAHIGVLEAFRESGLEVDLIAGTSMGSIIGAAYCLTKDIDWVKEKILKLIQSREIRNLEKLAAPTPDEEKRILIEGLTAFVKELYLWNMRAIKKWLVDTSEIETVISNLVKEKTFQDLMVPFFAMACDLSTGEEVVIEKGRLKDALVISSAIPGVFNPVEREGKILVDGGIITLVPINVCRNKGADFIIAIDVSEAIPQRQISNGMEIIFQADLVTQHELNRLKLKEADFVITPDVKNLSWAQFSASKDCVEKGKIATRHALPKIKSLIEGKKRKTKAKKSFFRQLFPF